MGVIAFNGKELPRLKLSFFGEPVFYVNEKKKSTTCKLMAHLKVPNDTVGNLLCIKEFIIDDFVVTATVTLQEGDEWDSDKGRRLAYAKAKKKAYMHARQLIINECLRPMMKSVAIIANACDEMKEWAHDEVVGMDRLSPGLSLESIDDYLDSK